VSIVVDYMNSILRLLIYCLLKNRAKNKVFSSPPFFVVLDEIILYFIYIYIYIYIYLCFSQYVSKCTQNIAFIRHISRNMVEKFARWEEICEYMNTAKFPTQNIT
jgi:hypothetical protein